MSTFLLLISFTLNGVAILAIINLYLRQNRLKETENKVEQSFEEMESIISSYLFEMKEENEAFIKRFKEINSRPAPTVKDQQGVASDSSEDELVSRGDKVFNNEEDSQEVILPKIEHTSRRQALNSYRKATKSQTLPYDENNKYEQTSQDDNSKNDNLIEDDKTYEQLKDEANEEISLIDEIKLLQEQNLTLDQIAKKLNKGKTEIELILKLQQNS